MPRADAREGGSLSRRHPGEHSDHSSRGAFRPGRMLRAVLRPAAGRRLPRELRARRVGRLAAALPGGLDSPQFAHLLQRIDAAPLLGGHQVEVYLHGEPAYAAMREEIRAAREEVLVEAYIVRDDATGQAILDDLAAAAARGVAVRL